MDGDLFGFGGGYGGGWGGGCGGPTVGAPYAALMPATQPSGVVCPPQSMQAFDPCDPRLQYLMRDALAKQAWRMAGAQKGAMAKAAAGQPAKPIGIGTAGIPTATAPLVPGLSAFTFSVPSRVSEEYCFIDLDVSRAAGANFFLITNVTIGDYSVINDPIGIAADTLSPDAIHPLLELGGGGGCGGDFSITVFNTDSEPQRFNATLYGIPRWGRRNYGGPCL